MGMISSDSERQRGDEHSIVGSNRFERQPSSQVPVTHSPQVDGGEPVEEAAPAQERSSADRALIARLEKVEARYRRVKLAFIGLSLFCGYLAVHQLVPPSVLVKRTLMESEELKLVDGAGNTRFFLRMYSRVPVLQLLDTNGKPRMSLGMRFDETPFIDLSDKRGRTRATFEMTGEDEPMLRLFDEDGEATFKLR